MPSADAAVGMMDAAYFVGRKELLDFLNSLLDLSLKKIEETATGAVACQIFDMMFPNSIPMSRVNWEARSDYEFVQNYKLLQNGFTKQHVQRYIDVDKLIRAKYQDNLEFMQWFKAFYEKSGAYGEIDDYVPSAVRARGKGGKKFNDKHGSGRGGGGGGGVGTRSVGSMSSAASSRNSSRASSSRSAPTVAAARGTVGVSARSKVTTTTTGRKVVPKQQQSPDSPRSSRPLRERAIESKCNIGGSAAEADAALVKKNNDLQTKVDEMEVQNGDLQTKVDELELAVLEIEKERDFYFDKLRHVEVMLQVYQDQETDEGESNPAELVDKIFKVLYATANIAVDDDGELVDTSVVSEEQEQEEGGGEEEEEEGELLLDGDAAGAAVEAELDEVLLEAY